MALREYWCEEALVDSDMRWFNEHLPEGYKADAKKEGDEIVYHIFKGNQPKAVCRIYRKEGTIYLEDKVLYDIIKEFGESRKYEKLIKCWRIEE